MIFNSIEFAIFFVIVFILYWCIINKNLKAQNGLLLIASYVFYGWWDWRFLFLLFFLSLTNYFIGIGIEKTDSKRKGWLFTGLIINLGVLCIFKYYNFFVNSFIDIISVAGYHPHFTTLNIILPLGISFYVFLSLSYIIDIYKGQLKANRNIIEVLLTLGFFPIILAGPIQRPASLLPQIAGKREFSYDLATGGLKQILWGIFAKVVIADKLAPVVDQIFLNYSQYSGSTLLLGALLFAIQIYADFSGYSNMAIGIAKLLGFNLMQNFAFPYFSRDIKEFWKRWHISLTTWFRDYLFVPISFRISWNINKDKLLFIKKDQFVYIFSSLIVWILTGLWHGSNSTFIAWGLINGTLLIIFHLQTTPRKKLLKKAGISNRHSSIIIIDTIINLFLIIIAWIFFRATSLKAAISFIKGIFSKSLFSIPSIIPKYTLILVCCFFIVEWFDRNNQFGLAQFGKKHGKLFRYAIYYTIIIAIIWFSGKERQFIYSQF
jgi:alginate O-acetyltransferase complex protein AlgI